MIEPEIFFVIDTGTILTELKKHSHQFEKDFLVTIVQKNLKEVLIGKNVVTLQSNEENHDVVKNLFLNSFASVSSEDENQLPFNTFFFPDNKKARFPKDYVEFSESCILNRGDKFFDFFFALKFSLLDENFAVPFLKYHYANTFRLISKSYVAFLTKIMGRYPEILNDKYSSLIEDFIASFSNEKSKGSKSKVPKDTDLTVAQKVLFFHFLLNEFDIYRTNDKTNVAKAILLVTGLDSGAHEIQNSSVYKYLKDIVHFDKGPSKTDLERVKGIFEQLSVTVIVNAIQTEINKKT